jgi:hypothetical protein
VPGYLSHLSQRLFLLVRRAFYLSRYLSRICRICAAICRSAADARQIAGRLWGCPASV